MKEINFDQARFNMIEQQIRPAEVLDQRVLDVLAHTPREEFVPRAYKTLAFADMNIPLGGGQVMLTPILEGRMLQALSIQPGDYILEIGTGSGYTAALLAKLGRRVTSVEINPEFARNAQSTLNRLGNNKVTLEIGDAARDWGNAEDKHDVIAITGSLPLMPESYKHRLRIGGRMFAIVGDAPVMQCVIVTRVGNNEWTQEALLETNVPALLNAPQPQRFVF